MVMSDMGCWVGATHTTLRAGREPGLSQAKLILCCPAILNGGRGMLSSAPF